MQRCEHTYHLRFLTFSTFRRLQFFAAPELRTLFANRLATAAARFEFHLYAWVVMPEHVHLLLWPKYPPHSVTDILASLKSSVGRTAIPLLSEPPPQFWQRGGGYDRNIWTLDEVTEKMRYIEHNPVRRGLVSAPVDWEWSSARWNAHDHSGPVPLAPWPPRRPGAPRPPHL